ncbi:S-adenosyl-L-methionine-dependent methyltransferase [Phakopsora pachyrhizi]|uniref:S-adenosyl-L-methionine-dependent methyltransferase n=1 Tax=Phakopsora pachyrhizi TaxID=170000 RepID=A0AAV0BFW7_PHAPC|nr:S-adenosyl-L-methionine-dependent methyltransferase [Phakopsora pachyrhizi]
MDFYNQAARAIDLVDQRRGSLKSIVFNLSSKHFNNRCSPNEANPSSLKNKTRQISDGKRLLKVVAETLRFRQVIGSILEKIDILKIEKRSFGSRKHSSSNSKSHNTNFGSAKSLVLVLVHDQLFSPRGISLAKVHKIRQAVERHSAVLRLELSRLMIKQGAQQVSDLVKQEPPHQINKDFIDQSTEDSANLGSIRWLRVNTIKWSIQEAFNWLSQEGWTETGCNEFFKGKLNAGKYFCQDIHLHCLLAFPSSALILSSFSPYLNGRLIAQDKASCMPPQLLLGNIDLSSLNTEIQIIDATAAPGNKTTMLSAMVGSRGKVWAFEKDPDRYRTLKKMISRAGCTNVECVLADFLAVKHNDLRFNNVSHILVDPSCSGSGISNRLDHLSVESAEQKDQKRIEVLSRFQTTILSHALRFPSVLQVAYSTCSIWDEENEEVVLRVLKKPEMSQMGWSLKDIDLSFPDGIRWKRNGNHISGMEDSFIKRMARFDPLLDNTIGFFAVVFERTSIKPEACRPEDFSQSAAAKLSCEPFHKNRQKIGTARKIKKNLHKKNNPE